MLSNEILELFPTPVYTTMLPVEMASVIPFLNEQDMNTDTDYANYGLRSKDSYILDKLECKVLADYILEHVKHFSNDHLLYDYEKYKFSQSWISHKEPGQHHTMHTHPNSLVSGVFYYGQTEEKTPAIKFHKGIGGINTSYISPKTKLDKRSSKFAWETFSVDFEPGLLILFPSHLFHSVPLNETSTVRCSLAFNVVPTTGFGVEESLTELKF